MAHGRTRFHRTWLDDGHVSLRYNSTTKHAVEYAVDVIAEGDLEVCTFTEAQQPGVRRALAKTLGPDWRVVRKQEYMIAHKRATASKMGFGRMKIRRMSNVAKDWHDLKLAVVPLRLWTDEVVHYQIGHGPSDVQDGDRFKRLDGTYTEQVRVARQGYAAWGRYGKRVAEEHPNWTQVKHFDSNLDMRLERWRRWMERVLGGNMVWTHGEHRGSHSWSNNSLGKRLIDVLLVINGTYMRGHVARATKPGDMDHFGVMGRLYLPVRRLK